MKDTNFFLGVAAIMSLYYLFTRNITEGNTNLGNNGVSITDLKHLPHVKKLDAINQEISLTTKKMAREYAEQSRNIPSDPVPENKDKSKEKIAKYLGNISNYMKELAINSDGDLEKEIKTLEPFSHQKYWCPKGCVRPNPNEFTGNCSFITGEEKKHLAKQEKWKYPNSIIVKKCPHKCSSNSNQMNNNEWCKYSIGGAAGSNCSACHPQSYFYSDTNGRSFKPLKLPDNLSPNPQPQQPPSYPQPSPFSASNKTIDGFYKLNKTSQGDVSQLTPKEIYERRPYNRITPAELKKWFGSTVDIKETPTIINKNVVVKYKR